MSLERGNLYNFGNIKEAEASYKNRRDLVLDKIIEIGSQASAPELLDIQRTKLRGKIKEGSVDREYLLKYNWPTEKILITEEVVDFLLPQKNIQKIERKEFLMPEIKKLNKVILPTKEVAAPEIRNNEGMERKRIFPRFEMLVDFLAQNGIKPDQYFCYQGENNPEMMRNESYIMFVIPELKKMVLVCDEEGNASYIIHTAPNVAEFQKLKNDEEMEENERDPSLYVSMSKQDLQALKKEFSLVSWVKWDEASWTMVMADELTKKFDVAISQEEISSFLESHGDLLQKENGEFGNDGVAPEGWMTNGNISVLWKKDFYSIKNIANRYRETNPEWFKFFGSGKISRREYYSDELVLKIKKELADRNSLGHWMTNRGLCAATGRTARLIKKLTDKYRNTNPEWFKNLTSKVGREREYFSPELSEKITKELNGYEVAPEGWMTNRSLKDKLGRSSQLVKATAGKYRQEHPDWFKFFLGNNKTNREHYSPALVDMIEKELSEYALAPEGWMANKTLAILVGKEFSTVQKAVNSYKKTNPEWFKFFLGKGGNVGEHYSPELVEAIRKEFGKYDVAPDGWLTSGAAATLIGKSAETVRKVVASYRKANPEWFKFFLAKRGGLVEHYSPDLLATMKNEFSRYELAPDGWANTKEVLDSFKRDAKMVRRVLDSYRETNPEWYKFFLDRRGRATEHYSSELVARVRSDLEIKH